MKRKDNHTCNQIYIQRYPTVPVNASDPSKGDFKLSQVTESRHLIKKQNKIKLFVESASHLLPT